MNIKAIAESKKGQFSSVTWARTCKTLKSCSDTITKRTTASAVRIGASYDNMAVVKEGRANGELPKENQGLRGMVWINYPITLASIHNGREYLRIETASNSHFSTEYFKNGIKVEKSQIIDLLQSSEKRSGDVPTVMNIGYDTIEEIK